jgi:hypothetical protein
MRNISLCLLAVHLAAAVAQAQTFDYLQVQLGAYAVNETGGEKPLNMWRSTGPVVIGRVTPSTFSFGDTCEAWAVSSRRSEVREDAAAAWHLDITPVRVVKDAVTFRMRWIRIVTRRQPADDAPLETFQSPIHDVELTLRPGESWPVDSVEVPPAAKTVHGKACGPSASIRVSVDNYPGDQENRRLIGAELWLIERLANGKEVQRSQPLSARILPNRAFSFYFDSITDGGVPLDIFGTVSAWPDPAGIAAFVDTRARWPRGPNSRFAGPQQFVESEVKLTPSETVEIKLPAMGEGPYAKREFSIRIRARRLR